jgi:hypothetical protein
MKKETQEAKRQVLEHYRKHPLEVHQVVEEETEVFEMGILRNLGQHIKHETQVT